MSQAEKLTCLHCAAVNRVRSDKVATDAKCGVCGDKLISGKVTELDPATLAKATGSDTRILVVDFWAPWCGPCRMMAPEFAKAAGKLASEARFAKINTEGFPEVSAKYGIRGIPLLILFQNGREVARQAGAMPSAQIENFIRAKTGMRV